MIKKVGKLGLVGLFAFTLFSANAQSLKLMAFNTYLLGVPPLTIGQTTMNERVNLMLADKLFSDYDIIVLDELFSISPSDKLLKGLYDKGYLYQTPVLARADTPVYEGCNKNTCWNKKKNNWSSIQIENGGVAIVTKHKILAREQMIFHNKGCGFDATAAKGAVYVKVQLNDTGEIVHVFGTHTQAEDSLCSSGSAEWYRTAQFDEINKWIIEHYIPENEKIFIAGDLNVIKGSDEYKKMLSFLNVIEPTYDGAPATWDPKTNKLTNWSGSEYAPEYLDYILSYKNKAVSSLTLRALQPNTFPSYFTYKTGKFAEYSDHYPVVASENAAILPAYIPRNQTRYNNVVFKSVLNNQYIKAMGDQYFSFTSNKSDATKFNIYEWAGKTGENWSPDCIIGKDTYVRIRARANNDYWTFYPTNYNYYLKNNNPSDYLYMNVLKSNNSCLELNDSVALADLYRLNLLYYYLEVVDGKVHMSGNRITQNPEKQNQFIIEAAN